MYYCVSGILMLLTTLLLYIMLGFLSNTVHDILFVDHIFYMSNLNLKSKYNYSCQINVVE